MKTIQVIDRADNATFSLFQATDEEFAALFPGDTDMAIVEDIVARIGEDGARQYLAPIWERPVLKRDTNGIYGTLFYGWKDRSHHLPASRREVDTDERGLNPAQRALFRSRR